MRLAALTLLLAAGAAAQPSPATPGPAGAEAAVAALAGAQKVRDWSAVVRLLEPELVASLGDFTWLYVEGLFRIAADSALFVEDTSFQSEFSDDLGVPFRAARRLATVIPTDEPLSRTEMVVRILAADAARSPWRAEQSRRTSFVLLGFVAEADTLVHVVGRLDRPVMGPVRSTAELVTARWTEGQWVVVIGDGESNPLLEYLRFATENWTEILGHVTEDEEPGDGAMVDEEEPE